MGRLTKKIEALPPSLFVLYAIASAFTAYFCMYAFRKPFAAGLFPGELWGVQFKIVLVLSQLIGYALSKFLGIAFVSGSAHHRRAPTILVLIGLAELALLVFAWVPPAGQAVALFVNGLALGSIWGLVFSFLEGRNNSELLGAGLSTSYIFASGAVKAVGRHLIHLGLPEAWMPAVCGAIFTPLLLISVLALHQLPPPTAADQAARSRRSPMNQTQRHAFFAQHWPALVALTFLYMFLTAYRDFRDNFAVEIFAELGEMEAMEASVLATTEVWVALFVLACLAAIYRIKDNRRAFFTIHALMFAGAATIALSTLAHQLQLIEARAWMLLLGIGLYLAYVPYGCVLFDRLIATTRSIGTAMFMIYVTDSLGYLASIVVLLVKNFSQTHLLWLPFFVSFSYLCAGVCCLCFLFSAFYFHRTLPREISN